MTDPKGKGEFCFPGNRGLKARDLITCDSKVKVVFPRKLVSFVRPRDLLNFDHVTRHVTRSPQVGKFICLGRCSNSCGLSSLVCRCIFGGFCKSLLKVGSNL